MTTLTTINDDEKSSKFSSTLFEKIKRYIETNSYMKIKIFDESNKFKLVNELIFHDENRVYVSKEVRLRVLKKFHDSSLTKHFERNKILTSIKRWFYWSKMKNLVKKYVKTCDTCMKTKLLKHFFHEKLLSLSVSNKAWSNITVNFIIDFFNFSSYKSADVFDCVMITVNRFTKMSYYFSCEKTMNFKRFAYLLIKDVINFHELFERIISDRETLFISHFWSIFSKKVKVDHRLFLSFHSQTDEQIERQNQTLKRYLKNIVNFLQNDWINHLSFAEYIYNDFHYFVI